MSTTFFRLRSQQQHVFLSGVAVASWQRWLTSCTDRFIIIMLACWKACADVSPFLVGHTSVSAPVVLVSRTTWLSLHILLAAKRVPLSWLQVFRWTFWWQSVGSVWLEIKVPWSAVLTSASGCRCRAPAAEVLTVVTGTGCCWGRSFVRWKLVSVVSSRSH